MARLGDAREFGTDDRKGQVAFAGNTAVASFRGGEVRLWDIATGKEQATIPHARDQAQYIAVSTDGVMAVKATDSVELWNLANMTNECLPSDPHPPYVVRSKMRLRLSRDSTLRKLQRATG